MDARELGRRLRWLRSVRGLDQSDVERATGLSQSQLSRLERGSVSRPAAEDIAILAKYYGLSVESLLGLEEIANDDPTRIRVQERAQVISEAISFLRSLGPPESPREENQSHFNQDYDETARRMMNASCA